MLALVHFILRLRRDGSRGDDDVPQRRSRDAAPSTSLRASLRLRSGQAFDFAQGRLYNAAAQLARVRSVKGGVHMSLVSVPAIYDGEQMGLVEGVARRPAR
jgi:hypothetical protein